jgi:hypothetical protein
MIALVAALMFGFPPVGADSNFFPQDPAAVSPSLRGGAAAQAATPPTPDYRYDASASASVTTFGGAVSAWTSTGGSVLNMAQGTAGSQPVSSGSGSSAQVAFDGTADFISASLTSVANSHIFVVVTVDSIGTNGTGAACNANDGVAGWFVYNGIKLRTTGGVSYVIAHNFDGSHDCAETTFTLGQKVILELRVNGSTVGVAVNGGTFVTTASGNTSVAGTSLGIGAQDASNNYADINVHDVLVYRDDQTDGNRALIIASLRAKWGI